MLEQLSADLQERRRLLGLSREEAYKKFRVPLAFIVAIEEGRLDHLPAPVYARGFLRTYCEGLGIAPEPRLHRLEDAMRRQPPRFRMPFFGGDTQHRPKWLEDALTWAAILGIVALGWLAYSAVFNPGAHQQDNRVQAQTIDLRGEDPFAAP